MPNIKYRKDVVGFVAELYDRHGTLIGEAAGFSKKDAKQIALTKYGYKKPPKDSDAQAEKPKKRKIQKHDPDKGRKAPKGSVMSGLVGSTGSRNWRYTK